MAASRIDTVSWWLSVVWASIAVTILGFQLADTDVAVSTIVFTVITSWLGLHFSLNHLYAVARRMKDGAR